MHLEILNLEQKELLPLLNKFNREFYLVGGTAIALQIGHRMSIDYDLFKFGNFRRKAILDKFDSAKLSYKVTLNNDYQLNLICKGVTFTFFNFEHNIPHEIKLSNHIKMPNLLDLSAMKAFALGHRSKWKDFVDLYFIIKNHFSISQISMRASELFGQLFSEKLFRAQLGYFEGIKNNEPVVYINNMDVEEDTVKQFLLEASLII